MEKYIYFFAAYIIGISLITAFLTYHDKACAKKHKTRVPEKLLFILAFLGGSFAEYLTMNFICHKTKHKSFMVGLPLIMLCQITLTALIIYHLSSH